MSDTVDTSAEAVEQVALAHERDGRHSPPGLPLKGDWLRSTATLLRALLRERDEARAEIAARERAARETALREAAAKCDARREVYEKKLTDEAAFFAAAYETASGLILALIDEEAAR